MDKNIQNFLDIMAGLREAYYKKDRELCAIKKYVEKMDTDNWQPQKINLGINQDEFVEINKTRLCVLQKELEREIRELEIKISQITISNGAE